MEKDLKELMVLTKCSLSITINLNRDYYQTIEEHINDLINTSSFAIEKDLSVDVYKEIVKIDNLIEITSYPDTPIGSYTVYHYDLHEAIKEMIKKIKK